MELLLESKKVEKQCTDVKTASRHFGGNKKLVTKLFSRVNLLEQAVVLKDIVAMPQLHFHQLTNKDGRNLEGCFAIDIDGRKCPWRLVLQPLGDDRKPFDPCHIHEVAETVRVVGIMEVSRHYE